MRTTSLAIAAAAAAGGALAKDAGGFQLLYRNGDYSWCVQPRAEGDDKPLSGTQVEL